MIFGVVSVFDVSAVRQVQFTMTNETNVTDIVTTVKEIIRVQNL